MTLEQHKLDEFFEYIKNKIPDIKCDEMYLIDIPDNIKVYQSFVNSEADNIDLVLYNLSYFDIENIVNDCFSHSSINIKKYFSLILFYNKIIYGVESDKFNLHLDIRNKEDGSDLEINIYSLSQNYNSIMLWFYGYSHFQKIDFVNINSYNNNNNNNNNITFCIELINDSSYDAVMVYLNKFIGENLSLEDIRFSNIDEYHTLFKMIKF